MRALYLGSAVLLVSLALTPVVRALDAPVYINFGGPEVVDSFGRTWLGDQGAGADVLDIRPDDAGGFNTIEGWCNPSAASVSALVADSSLGVNFNGSHPGDVNLFRSIRWDLGGEAPDYVVEIPIAPGSYRVAAYFCESCCPNRHSKVLIQGEVAFPDVSVASYAGGATHTPGVHEQADVMVGEDGILNLTLLGCLDPECPGGGDGNPTLTALAVVPSDFDPCSDPGFRACPGGLGSSVDGDGNVSLSWNAPVCIAPTGYEVSRDGEVIANIAGDSLSFDDSTASRLTNYSIQAQFDDDTVCPPMEITVLREEVAFDVPVRINMGGVRTTDSLGREWLGDGPGGGDPLAIRPNDLGGANTIEFWCALNTALEPDALQALGLDPYNSSDVYVFNTIRWDNGGDAEDYALELPIADGDYIVNLYFNECGGGTNRHFKIEMEGASVDNDVNSGRYSAVAASGRTGILSYDATVADGALSISLLPCGECLGATDTNPILNAVEVVPAGTVTPVCARQLRATANEAGDMVDLAWMAPIDAGQTGYDVLRNGASIGMAAADATTFTDDSPPCNRTVLYELVPLFEGDSPCPGIELRAVVTLPDCPFAAPIRVNMGGRTASDSSGNLWVGDPGAGADVLGMRPNDDGGTNAIENWSAGILDADSFTKLGLDPTHPGDVHVFTSIRWDPANDAANFIMDLPLAEPGTYTVNMYFNEACCVGRNFKIQVHGAILDDNVSYLDYDAEPALGKSGVLSFEGVLALDNILIGLLPCPECPRPAGVGADNNAIIDALEIIRTGDVPDGTTIQIAGDCNQDGGLDISDLMCSIRTLFPGFLLLGSSPSPCGTPEGDAALLDFDGSGGFSTVDVVGFAQYLFGGGQGPALGTGCGPITVPGCNASASCP